jgi:ATP synthase protein I
MDEKRNTNLNVFSREVGEKEKRKVKSQSENKKSPWSGFGLFGIIGWSIVTPTLAGAALGIWLDKRFPQPSISWTLSFLIIGLVVGCLGAWRWINKEHKDMHKTKEEKND